MLEDAGIEAIQARNAATLALAVRRSLTTRPDLIYIQLTDEIIALLQSVDFVCVENKGLLVTGNFYFNGALIS